MVNIKDLCVQTLAALIFCAAIYVLFQLSGGMHKMLCILSEDTFDTPVVYQYNYEYNHDCIVTYDELCSLLMSGSDYSIRVLSRNGAYTDNLIQNLKKCNYKREYHYDADGNISFIEYMEER